MKELERPLKEHYETETDIGASLATFNYIEALDKYVDQLESERDEYKLKEGIAYSAKEIAEEAHQKVVKERDELKEDNKETLHWMHMAEQELQTLKEDNSDLDENLDFLAKTLMRKVRELQTLKEAVEKFLHSEIGNDTWSDRFDKLKELIK